MPTEEEIQAAAQDALSKTANIAAGAVTPHTDTAPVFSEAEHERYPWLPAPQPFVAPTPADQQTTFSEQDIQAAAADAFNKTKPASADVLGLHLRSTGLPADLRPGEIVRKSMTGTPTKPLPGAAGAVQQALEIPIKEGIKLGSGVLSAGAQAGAAITGVAEAPDLRGLSIPQVEAAKAQMQAQLVQKNKDFDDILKSGATPDDGGFHMAQVQFTSQQINSLQARIAQADDIIATHRPLEGESPMSVPWGNALRQFGEQAPRATQEWVDRAFPTNQDFTESPFGKIESLGADGIVLVGSAALGPIGPTATAASMFMNTGYEEAKKLGADDETAERASLLTGVVSAGTMAFTGFGINALAKSFAGLSAKEGINALVKTIPPIAGSAAKIAGQAVAGGTEMAAASTAANMATDAITKLNGYEPNRNMGATWWQNFWLGSVFGAVHGLVSEAPRMAAVIKPNVGVREAKPFAQMPGPQGFILPTEGRPPQAPEVAAAAAARPAITGPDTRSAEQKMNDWAGAVSKVPDIPIIPGESADQLEARRQAIVADIERQISQGRQFTLGAGTAPVYTGEPRPVQERAQTLSLGAPTIETLETESQGVSDEKRQQDIKGVQAAGPQPQEEPERIVAAAVRHPSGDVYTGAHHPAALEQMYEARPDSMGTLTEPGFVTNKGRFVDREEAYEIAQRAGQEKPGRARGVLGTEHIRPETLQWVPMPQEVRSLPIPDEIKLKMYGPEGARKNPDTGELEVRATTPSIPTKGTTTTRFTPAWYDSDEPFAMRRPVAAELPPDRVVNQNDVKAEVQQAQEKMGMHDNLVYVPTTAQLPKHVRDGMNADQINNTAQIVTDRKLGNVYVVGDRFSSLNDLRKAIIEETIPYRYRNLSRIGMVHNPYSNDLGNYDHISDRPILNTHALLRSGDPYQHALKTAMEEVNAHQGISRLLGPREGVRYINGMNDVQAEFNRLQLNDILAQKKGYKDADDMAKAYKVPDWRTDPKQAHKMTEELIGAYAQTFKTPEDLMANAPSWYQLALKNIGNGIRRFLGLRVDPYDVQSLIADSAAALRSPKWALPSSYHPIGDAAKAEMAQFQFANRPPPVAGEEGAAKPGEKVDIGTQLVKSAAAKLQAGLGKDEFIAQQARKIAFDTSRNLDTRLAELRKFVAVDTTRGHAELMGYAKQIYNENFNGDPTTALDHLINVGRTTGGETMDRHTAVVEYTSRRTTEEIQRLRDSGNGVQADIMQARLNRMEQLFRPIVTDESARGLAAQKLRHMTGESEAANHRDVIQDVQQRTINTKNNSNNKRLIDRAKAEVDKVTQQSAEQLRTKADVAAKNVARRWGATMELPQGQSIVEQYTDDLVRRISESIFKTSTFTDRDKPTLQGVFDTFKDNIQSIIKSRIPKDAPSLHVPKLEPVPKPAASDTLRTILDNYPYYKEAWAQTMDMLREHNPGLVDVYDRALEEPVGEALANRLASEQGQNLSDLIYNHFATTDRVNSDLASKIINQFGLPQDVARTFSQHLQNVFNDIVRQNQQDKLASILKSVDGPAKPAQGELGRLVDHIVIGGLDNKEWLNLVAPRFGIDHYTPETIRNLKIAGDKMAQFRDDGLQNSSVAQRVRQDLSDIAKLSRVPLIMRPAMDALRYINDIYAAGLLTGPLTHAPYWQQAMLTQMYDAAVQGMQAIAKTGDIRGVTTGMVARFVHGIANVGWSEFAPILAEGIKPAEEFLPQRGNQPLYRSSLEKTAPFEGVPVVHPVAEFYRNYRYVRNFLDAISNLMVRGAQYATWHANAMSMAWDHGIKGQEAYDTAAQVVLGSREQQQRAKDVAAEIAQKHGFNKHQQTMLTHELLDQYKTDADDPGSSLHDLPTQQLRDVARRSFATGLSGSLRGDVRGAWGKVSRGLLNFTGEYVGLRPLAEFLKVPFNLVNEQMAWSPIGIFRSAKDLVPSDNVKFWISHSPLFGEGVEGYMKAGMSLPERAAFERQRETGEISDAMIRDLAWNQMSKGMIGTALWTVLGSYVQSQLTNPNPAVRFTYSGPSDYGQQEIERGKGWQQNAVYLDPNVFGPLGGWHSYENTPLRPLFASLGAYSDYFRYEKQADNPALNEVLAMYHGINGSITSMLGSPLQGMEAALHFLTTAASAAEGQRAIGNFVSQAVSAAATTPVGGTFTRQVTRLFDPTQYEAKPSNPWSGALRYVPVVNAMTGEPKLNVFGQHMLASPLHNIPEYTPSGGLAGFHKVVDANDPVWNYLEKHPGLKLTMPGNSAAVGLIKMTPDEIYEYHKARGPALYEELSRAFEDPEFREAPVEQQNYLIAHVYEHIANMAGAEHVMDYRETHPVTKEREAAMLKTRGIVPDVETVGALPPDQPAE